MAKVSIVYATRTDGNGKPIQGYYVTDYGIPLGPAHATKSEAMTTLQAYVADINRLISEISK